MKALLMHRDHDLDLASSRPATEAALVQDLGLTALVEAMSQGVQHIREVAEKVLPLALTAADDVKYRQDVLRDCIQSEGPVREVYDLCVETIDLERKNSLWRSINYPAGMLHRAVDVLEMLASKLRRLRAIAEEHQELFRSEGLRRLSDMLQAQLGDEYLAEIGQHLKELKFRHGVTLSASLGEGNKARDYVLRRASSTASWLSQLLGTGPETYTYRLPDRDESGARALSDLQDRGINLVANALTQSTNHILAFFQTLQNELAFYIGCLNLRHELLALGAPIAMPEVHDMGSLCCHASGLIDAGLLLNLKHKVIENDLEGDGKALVMITGANQGGKSTFLRSIGLAQVMMQSGMFVTATRFAGGLVSQVYTHFKREEDASMNSGKFDEELVRMDGIVSTLTPHALVLFNESFASTNEHEGSLVAREIVTALRDSAIKVVFVTHQYELADGLYREGRDDTLFLRAERETSGERTFKVREAEPLRTSFGEDLYHRIFGKEQETGTAAPGRERMQAIKRAAV